jgi:hypothetical protein
VTEVAPFLSDFLYPILRVLQPVQTLGTGIALVLILRDCRNSLNQPPISPNLGGLFKAGGHPQTPGRKYPAPLFQRSQICLMLVFTLFLSPLLHAARNQKVVWSRKATVAYVRERPPEMGSLRNPWLEINRPTLFA